MIKRDCLPARSEGGLAPRLAETEKAVWKMLGEEKISGYSGVGIAMPGIIDPINKKVLSLYGKYEDSKQIDLSAWCDETFGLPLEMDMDAKAALLGELHYGCGVGYKDVAMLVFGTGVGTAVMINGELLSSRNFAAGALSSHLIIDVNGRKCTCPNNGCMEAGASGWALEGLAREHPGFAESGLAGIGNIDFAALEKCYIKGDPAAADVLRHCVAHWRAGILNMIHAYDPALVVLSGGIMKFNGLYRMLTDGLHERIWDCCGKVEVKQARHLEDSVLYGLYHMVCRRAY